MRIAHAAPGPLLALLLASVALAAAIWQVPRAFRAADATLAGNSALTPEQRQLLPARSVDMATEPFTAALQDVPPNATYAVVTGDGVQVSNPLALSQASAFAAYALLPRRLVRDTHSAEWILSFGGDLGGLGLRYRRVITILPGYQLAEVER